MESLDSALGVLGDSVRDLILRFMESKYSISKDDIPTKLDKFMESLHSLLGYGGSVVEKLAMKNFLERIHLPPGETTGKSLVDLAKLVRGAS